MVTSPGKNDRNVNKSFGMLRQKNLCGLKTSTISIEKYEISFLIVCVKLGIFKGEIKRFAETNFGKLYFFN